MSDTRSKEYRQKFADRVHYARTEAGYSQTQISKLLGIRQTTYSNYEGRGNSPPSIMPTYLLRKFCQITGVTLDWLIGDDENSPA